MVLTAVNGRPVLGEGIDRVQKILVEAHATAPVRVRFGSYEYDHGGGGGGDGDGGGRSGSGGAKKAFFKVWLSPTGSEYKALMANAQEVGVGLAAVDHLFLTFSHLFSLFLPFLTCRICCLCVAPH
jgi:hypothetical protein